MYRVFGVQDTYKWAANELLPILMEIYDTRVYSSIGKRSDKVRRMHEKRLVKKLNAAPTKTKS